MEREEKLADPQSSLVTPWTRCSFQKYSMVQSDLPAVFSPSLSSPSFLPSRIKSYLDSLDVIKSQAE